MSTQRPSDTAIREWLARAHPEPSHPREQWTTQAIAIMPLGRAYDAVRLPGAVVRAAVATDSRPLPEFLADRLGGAVICGSNQCYYALVKPRIGWNTGLQAEYLGSGTWLGVPRLDVTEPPGSHWSVPPRHEGDLCAPQAVAALISAGLTHQAVTVQSGEAGGWS